MHKRVRWASMSCALLLMTGCILSPHGEFESQYEESMIGQSYSRTVAQWPGRRSERVADTSRGNATYRVPLFLFGPNTECVVYYEVASDEIIRAWHEGDDCAVTH